MHPPTPVPAPAGPPDRPHNDDEIRHSVAVVDDDRTGAVDNDDTKHHGHHVLDEDGGMPSDLRFQLLILGLTRFTETLSWTSIFPYTYFLFKNLPDGPPQERVPFYAGALVASMTLAEFASNIPWAYLSDRVGRRPTILCSSFAAMICPLWFGLSRSTASVLLSRAVQGLINPSNGMIPTVITENVGPRKHLRAKAFSFTTIIRSFGLLAGPALGGALADPASVYPGLFSAPVWKKYPYLLPNLVVALLHLLVLALQLLYLEETHPTLKHRLDPGLRTGRALSHKFGWKIVPVRAGGDHGGKDDDADEEGSVATVVAAGCERGHRRSTDEDLPTESSPLMGDAAKPTRTYTRQVVLQTLSLCIIAFHKGASDVITPTYLAVPRNESPPSSSAAGAGGEKHYTGGFGLNTQQIGNMLLVQAVMGAISQFVIPSILARWGALASFRGVLRAYPFLYVMTPMLAYLPPWLGIPCMLVDMCMKMLLVSIAYIGNNILIICVSRPDTIARVNGASASFGSLTRGLGPMVAGDLFGWGLKTGHLGVAYWVLAGVSGIGAGFTWLLTDQPSGGG